MQVTNSSGSRERISNTSDQLNKLNADIGIKTYQNSSPAQNLSHSFKTKVTGLDTGFSKIST